MIESTSTGIEVDFREVRKQFRDRVVLDGISLTIPPGKITALIGPSGGGKSTLLRCINGLTRFEAGQIRAGDLVLTPTASRQELDQMRRQFGMIFQDFQLFPHMTALQNVMEAPIRVLSQTKESAARHGAELLARMGLDSHLQSMPRQLSGGQKQRVAIARALAMSPQGLLCDEITSALDPELKGEVLDTVQQLRSEGMTIIMVTHEIHFARQAADHVIILADGRVAEQGSPSDVIDNPQSERAKRFLGEVLA